MGLAEGAVKLFLELWQRGHLANVHRMMEMGSQELALTDDRLDTLIRSAGISDYDQTPFAGLSNYPGEPRVPAKPFYQLLGIEHYSSFDVNEQHGAVAQDLNQPLSDSSLVDQFDLVTDHCAIPHAFNITEAYKTMHRLCKPGGLMVMMVPSWGGNGYYNFDPAFFEGMAAANQYRVLFSSYFVTVRQVSNGRREISTSAGDQTGGPVPDQYHIPLSTELLRTFDWSKGYGHLGICYVLQKQLDKDYQFAYQGIYQTVAQDHYGYELQFLANPPSHTYVPLRGNSKSGALEGVLETIGGKTIARHLIRRAGRRLKRRIGLS